MRAPINNTMGIQQLTEEVCENLLGVQTEHVSEDILRLLPKKRSELLRILRSNIALQPLTHLEREEKVCRRLRAKLRAKLATKNQATDHHADAGRPIQPGSGAGASE